MDVLKSGEINLKEGAASLTFPADTKVFYNKVQVFNRDVSVLVISVFAKLYRESLAQRVYDRILAREKSEGPIEIGGVAVTAENILQHIPPLRVFEGLSATGLRSIRYAREIPDLEYVVANDFDAKATHTIAGMVAQNNLPRTLVVPNKGDAATVLHLSQAERCGCKWVDARIAELKSEPEAEQKGGEKLWEFPQYERLMGSGTSPLAPPPTAPQNAAHNTAADSIAERTRRILTSWRRRRGFDVVDLDPYGSASPFLDGAVSSVSEGGLLCVTCTDKGVLGGRHVDACYQKYTNVALPGTGFSHEEAVRLALASIQMAAARHDRYIVPILSLSPDFYIRVFCRVFTQPLISKHTPTRLGYLFHCVDCPAFRTLPLARRMPIPQLSGKSRKHRLSRNRLKNTDASGDSHSGTKTNRKNTRDGSDCASQQLPTSALMKSLPPVYHPVSHRPLPYKDVDGMKMVRPIAGGFTRTSYEPAPESSGSTESSGSESKTAADCDNDEEGYFVPTRDFAFDPRSCEVCGARVRMGGPVWLDAIHDREFVLRCLRANRGPGFQWDSNDAKTSGDGDAPSSSSSTTTTTTTVPADNAQYLRLMPFATHTRIRAVLSLCAAELPDCPFSYHISRISQAARSTGMKNSHLRSALLHLGYRVSQVHCSSATTKTDAPPIVVVREIPLLFNEWHAAQSDAPSRERQRKFKNSKPGLDDLRLLPARVVCDRVAMRDGCVGFSQVGEPVPVEFQPDEHTQVMSRQLLLRGKVKFSRHPKLKQCENVFAWMQETQRKRGADGGAVDRDNVKRRRVQQNLPRYLPNPEPQWGPKAKGGVNKFSNN